MKKALVLAAILSLATFGAFAGLTGEFSSTITIDPLACAVCYNDLSLMTLGASLKVDYALDDWTFGTVATFDDGGFSNMKFSVAGVLGAFTLSSNMTFDPMAVTVWTYSDITQTASDDCLDWCPEATTWGPRFLQWDVTAGVSIAGVTFEAYVLQDYDSYTVTYVGKAVGPGGVQSDTYSCEGTNGMGWRLKVAGSFGAVDVTSYTYFNLSEADARETYCPTLGKRGVFTVGAGCDFDFTEEFLLLEGFTFGCAVIDVQLKILCDGFDSIEFLVQDISIGGWMTMDFKLAFTTDSKSYDFCIALDALAVDCFIVELGFGNSSYVTDGVIGDITVHGIGYEYTWNGISFKSYTEFDIYSDLISAETATGSEKWSYVDGCSVTGFWVPFAGSDCGTCVMDGCDEDTEYVCINYADGKNVLECVASDRYKVWEKFVIDVDADACCGGLFDLTFTTLFGDYQVLDWAGYGVYTVGSTVAAVTPLLGTVPADTFDDLDEAQEDCDSVSFDYDYKDGTQTTLFNWAKTEVDLGVGIGSNVTLTLGFDISAFGWEELAFGFKWTF